MSRTKAHMAAVKKVCTSNVTESELVRRVLKTSNTTNLQTRKSTKGVAVANNNHKNSKKSEKNEKTQQILRSVLKPMPLARNHLLRKHQLDFVHATANLRARSFKIPVTRTPSPSPSPSRSRVAVGESILRRMSQRPTATSTALIASGLCVMQLFRLHVMELSRQRVMYVLYVCVRVCVFA